MTKSISIFIILLMFFFQTFGQDILANGEKIVIRETITTIDKSKLFSGWEKFAKDTTNPTFIMEDLNGDGKLENAGFFTGIDHGFFIFGNLDTTDVTVEQLYRFPFDSSWFQDEKLQVVMDIVKSEKKIKNLETGLLEKLRYNSVRIFKSDGSTFIVTYKDNDWKVIKIK
jgi:hypothetical protein